MKFIKNPLVQSIVLMWGLILIPVLLIIVKYENIYSLSSTVIFSLALSISLVTSYFIISKLNKFIATVLILLLFFGAFFIRLILSFVYDFSGRGFTSEFFAHFSWASFKIGFTDYGSIFVIAILAIVLLSLGFIKFVNKIQFKNTLTPTGIFLLAIVVIAITKNDSPEWRLYQSAQNYYSYEVLSLSTKEIRELAKKELQYIRPSTPLPMEKKHLTASLPQNPKNLILIYLESFSDVLTNNKDYPGLTPNIDQMKQDYFSFSNNFSSAYVTIEGIANSQCGTLMNMESENNSLTTQSGRLINLPCLGDVLKQAGYKQIFYGGADLEFAGKGAFLKEHGYDEIKGKEHWKKLTNVKLNQWGLTDPKLLEQAILKIKQIEKEEKPFNLTLLTLGTHIPGFMYEGCQPYVHEKEEITFLNAVHCTDYLLGKFISTLKQENLLENTVVYIQGDHTIFPTSEMKNVFGSQALDRRVFSLIIDDELDYKNLNRMPPTSSNNLVANILDLLHIKNNASFILAESDFEAKRKVPTKYFMTRYYDVFETEKVTKDMVSGECNKESIVPPLDSCEKNRALHLIYQLDASYASRENRIDNCFSKNTIKINEKNGLFELTWAGKDISKDFIINGRKIKNQLKGIYVVKLNQNDQILSQLVFNTSIKSDLNQLKNYLLKEKSRYFIFTNLSSWQLSELKLDYLPSLLIKNKWLYAYYNSGKVQSYNQNEYPLGKVIFPMESCVDSLENIGYSPPLESNKVNYYGFCPIKDWGPKQAELGRGFNTQPNGLSAFWVKTNCAPIGSKIRINTQEIETTVALPIITAAVDDKLIFSKEGGYQIELIDSKTGKTQKVGIFTVNNKTKVKR